MKEDRILLGNIQDKIHRCTESFMPVRSDFLDLHQRSIVESKYFCGNHGCEILFFGGYDGAERVCCLMLPEYGNMDEDHGLVVMRVIKEKGSHELTHRDYLGSLMAIGLKREKIGDILVNEQGADIIVAQEVAKFLSLNYDKAGRVRLEVEIVSIDQLRKAEERYEDINDSIASLRLDNCISSAFNTSRSKGVESIKGGMVFVNNKECIKSDKEINIGDKIVFRGKGKAYLLSQGGKSRKNRIYVTFRVYK